MSQKIAHKVVLTGQRRPRGQVLVILVFLTKGALRRGKSPKTAQDVTLNGVWLKPRLYRCLCSLVLARAAGVTTVGLQRRPVHLLRQALADEIGQAAVETLIDTVAGQEYRLLVPGEGLLLDATFAALPARVVPEELKQALGQSCPQVVGQFAKAVAASAASPATGRRSTQAERRRIAASRGKPADQPSGKRPKRFGRGRE